jgi:hypothetical protein
MEDQLILAIDFETPPPAAELGEIFAVLARDYRDMTRGRVLVVTRVESGSITATLTDAALAAVPYVAGGIAVIAGANQLAKFAENLQKWFGYAKSDKEKKRLYGKGKKAPGQRSVEAIVKVAANTGSYVRVKHTTAKGETLEAELSPAEATSIVHAIEAEKAVPQKMERMTVDIPAVRRAIDRFQQAGTTNLSPIEIQTLVDIVVAVLQEAGAGHLLSEIASQLEARGLLNFADAVRAQIRPSGGKLEPPRTTT